MVKQVLWDWNGTLLDDVQYGLSVRNRVFPKYGLPAIDDLTEYRRQFTFPVRVYYERGGVTDENFDEIAHAWMDEYVRGCADVPLFEDTLSTLARLKTAGLRQVILTASQIDIIRLQLSYYPLDDYFDRVLGLGDIYARSKEGIGRAYLEQCGIAPSDTVMVGDTLHDADVARAMGVACVLVARGHQNEETLRQSGAVIVHSLSEAAEYLLR